MSAAAARRRVAGCAWAAAALAVAAAAPVHAQSVEKTIRPALSADAVETGDKAPAEHLLGDWGGIRPWLGAKGVDLTFSYESETAGVVGGGRKTGVDYAHSIGLNADVDWGKLAGLEGFSTHFAAVERAGRNASADDLGEALTEVQEIYGSGGNVAVHLSYLYGEQKLFGGKLDLTAGRLDVGQDFAASPLYCEFMTLSVCPEPRSVTIESGFTIFPTSTWGGRLKLQGLGPAYLMAGAYQVRAAGGGRSGFDFSTTGTTGALLPVELGFEPQLGPDRLVGHYKFGALYNTSSVADLWEAEGGGPLGVTAANGRMHRGQASFYVTADQMLRRTGRAGTDGVILLGGYTREDPHTAVISQLAFAGVLASGVAPGRPHDSIGVQVTWFAVSDQLVATQEQEAAYDLPLSSGLSTGASPAPGVQGHETTIEARYDCALVEGLHLMPDLQYVIHPDAATRYPDATVVGLRVTADF